MDVSVVVPYRSDGGHRDRAWRWIRNWWATEHPDWQVVHGRCPDGPWVKALAVTDALVRADGDLLVVADADVYCDGVTAAVEAVQAGAAWAVPHCLVHRLSESATAAVFGGATPGPALGGYVRKPYKGVEGGGMAVLPRSLYEQVPLDPRFAEWGQEDESFGLALTAVGGRRWRGTANLWHLWHEPMPRLNQHVGTAENHALHVRYQYAAQDGPDAVRALLDEMGERNAAQRQRA